MFSLSTKTLSQERTRACKTSGVNICTSTFIVTAEYGMTRPRAKLFSSILHHLFITGHNANHSNRMSVIFPASSSRERKIKTREIWMNLCRKELVWNRKELSEQSGNFDGISLLWWHNKAGKRFHCIVLESIWQWKSRHYLFKDGKTICKYAFLSN